MGTSAQVGTEVVTLIKNGTADAPAQSGAGALEAYPLLCSTGYNRGSDPRA
jgi:hypothetical protein